jgi:hypothetical protein
MFSVYNSQGLLYWVYLASDYTVDVQYVYINIPKLCKVFLNLGPEGVPHKLLQSSKHIGSQ